MRFSLVLGMVLAALALPNMSHAAVGSGGEFNSLHPRPTYYVKVQDQRAIYSYPVNTYPDGWAALKAEPWAGSQRMAKIYDGTLFLVIGAVPGWKLVRFKSGEQGWIAERLVGCCRPASH